MADISALPVQDWGNLMTSFGKGVADQQNTTANTGMINQQSNLISQQAQAENMENQIMQARMPIIKQALQDFNMGPSGSDTSGDSAAPSMRTDSVDGSAPAPASTGSSPSDPTDNSGVANWYDPARVDAGLRKKYFVNPSGTQQEMQNIIQAGLSGDTGLLEAAKQQRELNVSNRSNNSQNSANGLYESMYAVTSAPTGQKMAALEAVSPQAAQQIRKLIPDSMDEEAAAQQYAAHVASTVHQYSGRPVEADTGGTYRDKVTGEPIAGVSKAGMSAEQWTNLANHATELVPMKNSDGTESQVPRYKAESNGKDTLTQYMMRQATLQQVPGAAPTITGAPKAQAAAAASTAASTATKQPARAAAPPSTQQPGSTAASNPGLLPGVDLSTMPKVSLPTPVSGRTANPVEQAKIDTFKDNYKQVQTDAQRTLAETNQSDALLTPMQAKLNNVNARDVGPGSEAYKALMEVKAAVTGKAPQDLVDMGVLDKFANQLGVQNVRQLLSGQRITNQEMMNFLTRASASVTQPLDVMKTIISYQKANNDFDRKYATTALTALRQGVDPGAISSLQNGRTAFVEQGMTRDLGPQPQAPKVMPSGAKLKAYADKYYSGDQKKAAEFLSSQGHQ